MPLRGLLVVARLHILILGAASAPARRLQTAASSPMRSRASRWVCSWRPVACLRDGDDYCFARQTLGLAANEVLDPIGCAIVLFVAGLLGARRAEADRCGAATLGRLVT
jgi:hypothetical protein